MLPINLLTGGLIVIHRPELSHLSPRLAGISARIEWMPSLTTQRPREGVCKTRCLWIAMASNSLLGWQFDDPAPAAFEDWVRDPRVYANLGARWAAGVAP